MKKQFFKRLTALAIIVAIVTGLVQDVHIARAEESTQAISNDLTATSTTPDTTQTVSTESSSEIKPTVLCELTDKREASVKRFLMSDNTVQAVVYSQPIHYKENGEWKDIDNTLSMESAQDSDDINGYTNSHADFKVKIADNSSAKYLAKIQKGKYKIEFGLADQSKNISTYNNAIINKKEENTHNSNIVNDKAYDIKTTSDTVSYDGIVNNNSNIEYNVTSTGLKENIIIKSKQSSYDYTFDIDTTNLKLTLKDNIITAYDDNTNQEIYEIPAPYMYDANNEFSPNVSYTLTKTGSSYQLTISADDTWINRDNIKFPVTIDPIIKTAKSNVKSTFISSNMATTNFYSGYSMLLAGVESSAYNTCRTLTQFDLPQLAKGDIVTDARLELTQYDVSAYSSSTPDTPISAYKITSTWNESTVTWDTRPSYDTNETDYYNISKDEQGILVDKSLDITKIVKDWYDGDSVNYGILIRSDVEGTQGTVNAIHAKYKSERSTDSDVYPVISLTYHNSKGIEDYYSYTNLGAGSAGTAYVNDYTGNLYFEQNAVSTGGGRMPASVYLTYNTNNSDAVSFHTGLECGYGWKLNIEQYIIKTGNTDYPYRYTDADGTEHYFKKITINSITSYIDEDGLGLTLVENDGINYTITDQQDTVYTFSTNGNLTSIKDSNNNQITLTYNGGLIQYVTDGAGRNITISNIGGILSQIKDPADRATNFTFTNNKLTSITNPDGKTSSFTYNGDNSIATVIDPAGYKLVYTYLSQGTRVDTVTEYGNDTTGQKMSFNYTDYNTTKITTSGIDNSYGTADDIITTYQFDDLGRLTSTQAKAGEKQLNATDTNFTSGLTDTTLKTANRVTSSNGMGANVENLILNHDVESVDNWLLIKTGTCTETVGNSTYHYIGNNSLKIGVESATSGSNVRYRQMFTNDVVKPGKTYTFSGYINTLGGFTPLVQGKYGAAILVYCYLPDGTATSFYSDYISYATDNDINDGWRRQSVTFTVPSNATSTSVNLIVKNTNGSAYFDALQLEEGNVANAYNLLENASFENLTDALYGYSTNNLTLGTMDFASTNVYMNGLKSFRIQGEKDKDKSISQQVAVSGIESDLYVISGWAKAYSVPEYYNNDPNNLDRKFKISIKVTYTDGTYVWKSPVVFNNEIVNWQYGAMTIDLSDGTSADKTPSMITIYPRYDYQGNYAYFDNLSITKDNVANYNTYSYDTNGNMTLKTKNTSQSTSMGYGENENKYDLTSAADAKGNSTGYLYDTNHNLTQAVTRDGVYTEYGYDTSGNVIQSVIQNGADNITPTPSMKIQTDTSYTTDGAYVSTTSDQDNNVTSYSYDQNKGLLTSITNSYNKSTNYTYQANTDQLTEVSATVGGQAISNSYQYDIDRLTKITHNGLDYNFTYDNFGNNSEVKVGNQSLIQYNYNLYNGDLNNIVYGNQDTTAYTYDEYGNVTTEKVNGTDRYKSYTDKFGNTVKQEDLLNQLLYNYEYDINGRLIRQDVEDTSKTIGNERNLYVLEYGYDANNNVSSFDNKAGTKTLTHSYTYTKDDLLSSYIMPSGKTVNYTYDSLDRLQQYQIGTTTPITVDYSYFLSDRNDIDQTIYRTTKVRYETVGNFGLKYEYDNLGNITSISEKQTDGTYELINSYKYDELSQLIREDDLNQNKTKKYVYDQGGNITSIYEYAYSDPAEEPVTVQNTITYGYTDSNWKDKLTSYNGQTITYDEIGNPLSYNGYTYDWDNGRELKSIAGNGLTASYTYDENGLRVTKTVNGNKTNYEYVGGKLLYEKKGTTELHYLYDANGSLKGIQTVDGGTVNTYYVVTNTRGDVTQIYDVAGVLQVLYTYDAWGKILSIKDGTGNEITSDTNIGKLNSIRYRSYYYDTETGLYYLQSRYYNPEWGRFINADSVISTDLVSNVFAYCSNNPINRYDSTGFFWDIVDVGFAAWSWSDFINNPSLPNFGWAALDTLSLLPIIPSSGYVRRGVNLLDDALEAGIKFSKFSKGNFRGNLIKLIGNAPSWMKNPEAHHILPQKFESYFKKMGIDIHNPIYGTWVDKATHSKWSYKYNNEWEKFINSTTKNTTVDDIFKFANSLAKKYGFSTHY